MLKCWDKSVRWRHCAEQCSGHLGFPLLLSSRVLFYEFSNLTTFNSEVVEFIEEKFDFFDVHGKL